MCSKAEFEMTLNYTARVRTLRINSRIIFSVFGCSPHLYANFLFLLLFTLACCVSLILYCGLLRIFRLDFYSS